MTELYFILVEPAVSGNVGAAARAIKTMGFRQLRLVNPCDHLSREARMLAHASGEILETAGIYPDLGSALADIDLSIATTAKPRDARVTLHPNHELPGLIRSKGETVRRTGIVFGREESGLSNDEIRMCDLASAIPLKQSYPSLNLAQAVMIYAYTLAELSPAEKTGKDTPDKRGKSGNMKRRPGLNERNGREKSGKMMKISGTNAQDNREEFRIMMEKSGEILRKLGMDHSPALFHRILERIALLGEEDIHLLLSVLGRLDDRV